jgi:hypothetical protein
MGIELVQWRYSTTVGSAGNSQAQPDPNASLGGYLSTTLWTGSAVNNLFDNQMTGDQLAGIVDYRCVFAGNFNGTLALYDAVAYLPGPDYPTQSSIGIGADATGVVSTSGTLQAVQVGTETSAPAGVTFSSPTTHATAVVLGDLAPNTCRALWLRRTPTGAAAVTDESVTLRLYGTLAP